MNRRSFFGRILGSLLAARFAPVEPTDIAPPLVEPDDYVLGLLRTAPTTFHINWAPQPSVVSCILKDWVAPGDYVKFNDEGYVVKSVRELADGIAVKLEVPCGYPARAHVRLMEGVNGPSDSIRIDGEGGGGDDHGDHQGTAAGGEGEGLGVVAAGHGTYPEVLQDPGSSRGEDTQ